MLDQLFDEDIDFRYSRGDEAARRLGYLDAKFLTFIRMYKSINRLTRKIERLKDPRDKKEFREKLQDINSMIDALYKIKDDMLMFINRYPNAGIKSLSEKVMYESEFDYLWFS